MSDLDKRQINWQNWRNQLYSETQRASRDIATLKHALERNPKHQAEYERRKERSDRLQGLYFDNASPLDTAMKHARATAGATSPQYIAALANCEKFMAQHLNAAR